jgi:hypothetical protein
MLENPVLVLRPGAAPGAREIVAADTATPLGHAWWVRPGGWLARPILAVHEHEDRPLLFTVRRCWGLWPVREVRDAEGRRVGFVSGRQVRDRYGRRVAQARPLADRTGYVFLDPEGQALADLGPGQGGPHLTFRPEVAHDPFAKMLLLAAALGIV